MRVAHTHENVHRPHSVTAVAALGEVVRRALVAASRVAQIAQRGELEKSAIYCCHEARRNTAIPTRSTQRPVSLPVFAESAAAVAFG